MILCKSSFENRRNYREFKPGGWTTGLEEDEITWHSNYYHTKTSPLHGLEEKEIAVTQTLENHECAGLGKDEITWYLNWHTRVLFRFRRRWNYMVLKRFVKSLDFRLQCWVWQKIKLHDSQTFSLLFPLWRRAKLHGSQTLRCARAIGRKV